MCVRLFISPRTISFATTAGTKVDSFLGMNVLSRRICICNKGRVSLALITGDTGVKYRRACRGGACTAALAAAVEDAAKQTRLDVEKRFRVATM